MPYHIDYIEFQVPDPQAAQRFFEAAFGWEFTSYGEDYLCFNDGKMRGGFTRGPLHEANPLVVLHAVELELAEEAVRGAGGEIVREIFEFPGGRRFHFHEPNGLTLAVWSE